ncbi:UDP-glucose 4-epimerase-like [Corticium candelabrum]|uniref:UDP-glucose 4-epimerase-like n=1 Tax=Corticium candelabrum TaxID=121492 RepID=UPI002E276B92|nr:UDP-glucose 4-epimerase-like [Corticium candelabrum]
MSSESFVLVTGGAGYIGSHTVLELLNYGVFRPVVVDNMTNASYGVSGEEGGNSLQLPESLRRVQTITDKKVYFHEVDLLDKPALKAVFEQYDFTFVIHFAALKAVGESVQLPLLYYQANITGTLNLLEVMKEFGVKNIVFSSSATVYGKPKYLPINEDHPVGQDITNPYGRTKYFIEEILKDVARAESGWNIVILRYFNPVGAHKSGSIGEHPKGPPGNLMPYVAQVAVGRRSELKVYGDSYETCDGTGVRDYIHVVDLAEGHVAAVTKLEQGCGLKVYNLGTGSGYSVLEMVKALEKASGRKVPYIVEGPRDGDVPAIFGNADRAAAELNWKPKRGLQEMCEDLWHWQSKNPDGYDTLEL